MIDQLIFTPRALQHLRSLEAYLAFRFSERNAKAYLGRIINECNSLVHSPYRGTRRDDIRPGLRVIGFEKRVAISFEIRPEAVVIHGGRQPR